MVYIYGIWSFTGLVNLYEQRHRCGRRPQRGERRYKRVDLTRKKKKGEEYEHCDGLENVVEVGTAGACQDLEKK